MKNYLKYLLLFSVGLLVVSCEKWLNVIPPSEIRAEKHYSSVEGFQQTLLGCYVAMSKKDLYGETLTWHAIEMLARQYDARKNKGADDYALDRYNYQSAKASATIQAVWEKSYSVIVNANEALDYIDRNKSKLDSVNYRLIKGELLAIRAYLHFDLIRLFGHSDLANRPELKKHQTIPYLTTVNKETSPQLSYEQTLRNLITDLTEAARLLEIDPIRARYPESLYAEANVDGFYNFRDLHLNYFAVKALLARVCMWEGSPESKKIALEAALEVINDPAEVHLSSGLQLRTFTVAEKVPTSEMCFPSEQLFALDVSDLDAKIERNLNREYSSDDRQYRALCITNSVAESLFEIKEAGITDCRYKQLYHNIESQAQETLTPSKLHQETSSGAAYQYKNRMPLIRLPEMYYIAAECYVTGTKKDLEQARLLLDKVRTARAIYTKLDEKLDEKGILAEIDKEYKKEFICEGVVFYFYKRLGYKALPRQNEVLNEGVIIDDDVYMLPYPDFELQSGRVQ